MNDDPYQAPHANLDMARPPAWDADADIPEDVLKRIRHGCNAGLLSIAITLIATLVSLSGAPVMGLDAWALIDVAVMAGLVYGMHRKSRVCAVLMLLFYAGAFVLNTLVVRVLGLSVTYAVWSGVGTVLTAIIGIWYFKEAATAMKMVSIGLIVIGVMGLHSASRLPPA